MAEFPLRTERRYDAGELLTRRSRKARRWGPPILFAAVSAVIVVAGLLLGARWLFPDAFVSKGTFSPLANSNSVGASTTSPTPVQAPSSTPAALTSSGATATPTNSIRSYAFGDWFLVCAAPPAERSCIAQQQITDSSETVFFTWSLQFDAKGVLRSLWQTPADIRTESGFIIDAGDGKPRPVRFSPCDSNGCTVRGVLAPEFLKTLEASPHIVAAYVSAASTLR